MELRKEQEKQHARIIIQSNEKVLGWSSPAGEMRLTRRTKLVAQKANLSSDKLVIEIGCGTGNSSVYWYHHCKKLVAIDISEILVARAKTKHKGIIFEVADAEALPFKNNCVDAVIGNSVLHHVDIEVAFSEIRRILKPGGKFAFAEPNILNPQVFLMKKVSFLKKWFGEVPTETAFIRWIFAQKLKEYGFRDICIVPFDFLHPLLPSVSIPFVKRLENWAEKTPLIREIAGSLIISGRKK